MIDFSKVHFDEDRRCLHIVQLRARMLLTVTHSVDEYLADEIKEEVKKRMRLELHHTVYGELYRPIAELIEVALRSHDPGVWDRVQTLRDEIFELLKRP